MVLTPIPKSSVFGLTQSRSPKIDRFFKSKKRFQQDGFIEITVEITLVGGTKKLEYGYSKNFTVTNKAEYKEAIEHAWLNALGKVIYREGNLFTGSDDIKDVEDSDVKKVKFIDYFIYYPNFLNEKTIRTTRTRKDGSTSTTVKFMKKNSKGQFRFIRGGGLERVTTKEGKTSLVGGDDLLTREIFAKRESSYSKSRERAQEKGLKIAFAKALEEGKGKGSKEQKRLIIEAFKNEDPKKSSKQEQIDKFK